jgi:threonine synthase
VRYLSTRGDAPILGFADALLTGLASDGGLYVPEAWPSLPDAVSGADYAATAATVMAPFVVSSDSPEITMADLERLCREAYATFRHPAVAPLVQIDDRQWLLELFHGPTLAFKDIALQLVGRMFDHVLAARDERITIVGATSGDTGSAAIDGVRGCDRVDIVILYPAGRTSEVQRRQMTTVDAPNVHAVAVDGTFDDCQDLVKAMFADHGFRERLRLSAVNSINWARVMAQVVYYVTTARALAGPIDVTVPTGNFGNVLAGWIARRMGAGIDGLVVASNSNDILSRFINDRDMSTTGVVPTLSPSMDIQVSSNVERLLFEMNDRDGVRTAGQLTRFRSEGRLDVDDGAFDRWVAATFRAASVDDSGTLAEIARVHRETGLLIDPHTATGTAVARRLAGERPMVTLATAHPAKFPDAVERATGVRPPLPDALADLMSRPERTSTLPADLATVQRFVEGVSRATG